LRFGLPSTDGWWPALTMWMEDVLASPLPEGGALRDLPVADRLHEAVFHFRVCGATETALNALLAEQGWDPLERWAPRGQLAGLLTGAIDLVYRRQNRYFVADFKSNLLPDYGPARLGQAMHERRYDLQYLIYSLALHRHLKLRLPDYDYDRDFGGVRYLFLRGMSPAHPGQGIYETKLSRELIESLDVLLEGGLS
jgi:exodeoxyribonuclease V beta subunit